jgi:hypothetical protein
VTVEEHCQVWVGLEETPTVLVMLLGVKTRGHDGLAYSIMEFAAGYEPQA